MSLFKLSLLLASSLSFHASLARTPTPNSDDQIMVTPREQMWGLPAEYVLKSTTWLATIAECLVILSSFRDTAAHSPLLDALGPAEASRLSVSFLSGAFLVILGGTLRCWAFRALGPYFTFVQCIRKEHKLITSGPYALVRHPGYAGLVYCMTGWHIVHGSPGSWLRESGVLENVWIKVGLGCSSLFMVASVVASFRRTVEEDQYLSRQFGAQWQAWAKRVKYMLFPFVY